MNFTFRQQDLLSLYIYTIGHSRTPVDDQKQKDMTFATEKVHQHQRTRLYLELFQIDSRERERDTVERFLCVLLWQLLTFSDFI